MRLGECEEVRCCLATRNRRCGPPTVLANRGRNDDGSRIRLRIEGASVHRRIRLQRGSPVKGITLQRLAHVRAPDHAVNLENRLTGLSVLPFAGEDAGAGDGVRDRLSRLRCHGENSPSEDSVRVGIES